MAHFMHLTTCSSALLVFVLLVNVALVDSRGGGGGGGRGGSSGRGGGGGGSSGTRGSSGSRGGSIGGGTSTFSTGSGIGSAMRSDTFKKAIAGAAAGYLTYQAGKFIILAAAGPMMWDGRSYYWGHNYYQRQSGYEMCSMPMQPNSTFGDVYFSNMTRPKEIVWSCRATTEDCCGYECCPSNSGGGLVVFILFIVLLCCFAWAFYKRLRRRNDNPGRIITPAPISSPVPAYPPPSYDHSYPQSYPNPAYPLQPQQYPQQPPTYGSGIHSAELLPVVSSTVPYSSLFTSAATVPSTATNQ